MKDRVWKDPDNGVHVIFCPGCEEVHAIDSRWTFNGDMVVPTFNPSLLVTGGKRCHSFIRDGKIEFLNDCSHALKSTTVPLPEFHWES